MIITPLRHRAALGAAAVLLSSAARADLAADAKWANDFLGPSVTLPSGAKTPGAVHYWTDTVGVAFTRDVTIDIPPTPLDLNLDGKPDTTYSGKWQLTGGILANPALIGLVPTPEDPKGNVGTYSISTGFLGVREELDAATKKGTGRFGFNCLLCHAGADEQGALLPGRPNVNIQLGLIMATARALQPDWIIRENPGPTGGEDGPPITPHALAQREGLEGVVSFDANNDGKVTIAEWRQAMNMPPAAEAQATLILAGPGRLDQSIDYRMDGMIPLAQLNEHERKTYGSQRTAQKARASKRAVFNPVSIPANQIGIEVAHYSWSGKDSTYREDPVGWLGSKLQLTPNELADRIAFPHEGDVNIERLQRAITLDFRNVSTIGREVDLAAGIGWPHKVLSAPAAEDFATAEDFGAAHLRQMLSWRAPPRESASPLGDQAKLQSLIARGRELFLNKPCGQLINQRVLIGRETHVPDKYKGIAVLAPLDRTRPLTALIPVTCATCHDYSPAGTKRPIEAPLAEFQRCDLCHFDHPLSGEKDRFIPLAAQMQREKLKTAEDCLRCHAEHADFGRQLFSNSWLLPFDANGDARTHGDEHADGAAGGIGTDAHLNLDSLFASQLYTPPRGVPRQSNYLLVTDARRVPRDVSLSAQGFGWVRVAPLVTLRNSAPYLHNGSVPTLAALLDDPQRRPAKFNLGTPQQGFQFDTSLPGNGNMGHAYGVDFSADEKRALVLFLESIP